MNEEWRAVECNTAYEVSSLGRVRHVRNQQPLSPWLCNSGYPTVTLGGSRMNRMIHRLVAAAFIGECPCGKEVNHKDGVKTNNTPANLEYVTRSENAKHALRMGLRKFVPSRRIGEELHSAKLTESEVREIKQLYSKGGLRQRDIAEKYGVKQSAISRIVNGKRWSAALAKSAFALAFLLLSTPAYAGQFVSLIASAAAATDKTSPTPPAPSPTGECDNCNGTGKLGDGTVFVPCPVCGGDGIKSEPAAARSPAKPAEHLTHRSEGQPAKSPPKPVAIVKEPGPMWLQNGHSATVDHLVNVHGFDRATASRMTPAQRDIAHSNAHNASRNVATSRSSGCPGGVCPSPSRSRGLFRRR